MVRVILSPESCSVGMQHQKQYHNYGEFMVYRSVLFPTSASLLINLDTSVIPVVALITTHIRLQLYKY